MIGHERSAHRQHNRQTPWARRALLAAVAATVAGGGALLGSAQALLARPVNLTPPTITGIAQVGQKLKASHGTWSHKPTSFSYKWARCSPAGTECHAIIGAARAAYLVRERDVGKRLRVSVIAYNLAGASRPARSAPTAIVTPLPVPVNTSPPTISGSTPVGQTLTASHGQWTGSPTRYSYRWRRCGAAGANCTVLAATAKTYTLSEADLGHTLRVAVVASNAAGQSLPALSAPTAVVTGAEEAVSHLEYVLGPGMVHVYSIDEGFKEVESFSLPDSAGVRGVDVCPAKRTMYVSYGGDGGGNGNGSVLAYNLVEKRVIWNRAYSHGIDSAALTLDCSRLFEPSGENSSSGTWWILSTADGEQVGKVETAGSGPHDTVTSADGRVILLGDRNYTRLPIYDALAGTIPAEPGPLAGGVRPLTINGADTIAFTTATGLDGFQVSSTLSSAVPLYTESFGGSCPFSTCSHGISLSPDSAQVAVIDSAHKAVQFWDVHAVAVGGAPLHLATVAVTGLSGEESPCAYDCGRDGWVQHSFDGRYVFVGDSGDVIASATHQVVAHIAALENSRESIEVDWQAGVPVATTGRTGVGRPGG